jgi:F0F1-type ATP synthase assembly protein I
MDNRARSPLKLPGTAPESLDQSSLGLAFAFSALIGFGIGFGLDRLLHTRPWLMLVFTVLGLAAGFVNLVRAARLGR